MSKPDLGVLGRVDVRMGGELEGECGLRPPMGVELERAR